MINNNDIFNEFFIPTITRQNAFFIDSNVDLSLNILDELNLNDIFVYKSVDLDNNTKDFSLLIDTNNETSNETRNETRNETINETRNKTNNETRNETNNETRNETSNDMK